MVSIKWLKCSIFLHCSCKLYKIGHLPRIVSVDRPKHGFTFACLLKFWSQNGHIVWIQHVTRFVFSGFPSTRPSFINVNHFNIVLLCMRNLVIRRGLPDSVDRPKQKLCLLYLWFILICVFNLRIVSFGRPKLCVVLWFFTIGYQYFYQVSAICLCCLVGFGWPTNFFLLFWCPISFLTITFHHHI